MSNINFKFKKNWDSFLDWHDAQSKNSRVSPPWIAQKDKIQNLFESTVPKIIAWTTLWKEYDAWLRKTYAERSKILWSEQQRQIETLLLLQSRELNSEIFFLVFKVGGKPQVDSQLMNYWDAVRTKKNLDGDSNGVGGNEDIEDVTIVNIKNLL